MAGVALRGVSPWISCSSSVSLRSSSCVGTAPIIGDSGRRGSICDEARCISDVVDVYGVRCRPVSLSGERPPSRASAAYPAPTGLVAATLARGLNDGTLSVSLPALDARCSEKSFEKKRDRRVRERPSLAVPDASAPPAISSGPSE